MQTVHVGGSGNIKKQLAFYKDSVSILCMMPSPIGTCYRCGKYIDIEYV